MSFTPSEGRKIQVGTFVKKNEKRKMPEPQQKKLESELKECMRSLARVRETLSFANAMMEIMTGDSMELHRWKRAGGDKMQEFQIEIKEELPERLRQRSIRPIRTETVISLKWHLIRRS